MGDEHFQCRTRPSSSRTGALSLAYVTRGSRLVTALDGGIPNRLWLKLAGRFPERNKGSAESTEPLSPSRAAATSHAPQRI